MIETSNLIIKNNILFNRISNNQPVSQNLIRDNINGIKFLLEKMKLAKNFLNEEKDKINKCDNALKKLSPGLILNRLNKNE